MMRLLGEENGSPTMPTLMPQTRYQGSKRKLLPWIWDQLQEMRFESVLDAFGGSASVAYFLKAQGKAVTYNDFLQSNFTTGLALIENVSSTLSASDVDYIVKEHPNTRYDNFIERTFHDVFFLDEENAWLDVVVQNIANLHDSYRRAVAFHALFQACLVKRPYNLFHRRNLYMRTADVSRSFGNKATWDAPFETHFRQFVQTANGAVFDSGVAAKATCLDAASHPGSFDLVYFDPPYMNSRGLGTNYSDYYHFLDGMCCYEQWPELIDHRRRHLPLLTTKSPWLVKSQINSAFEGIFERFADSTIVLSYRSDGIPSIEELVRLLGRHKTSVSVRRLGKYKYALSTNRVSEEVLVIGQ